MDFWETGKVDKMFATNIVESNIVDKIGKNS